MGKKVIGIFLLIGILILSLGSVALDWSGDGLRAYEDISNGTDPLKEDTLGNGLTDYEEVEIHGTDPLKEDTLGNGLTDYEEVEIHGTDPLKEDTLGNGLTDYEEVEIHGTDPLKEDTLGNGLTDYEEVEIHGTDPLKEDTLGNGLTDYEEVEIHGTDPTRIDTSNNGLTDAEAVEIGLDPTNWDSSGDGLPDGFTYHDDGLDVDRYNVIIETNSVGDANIPEEIGYVVYQFDNAPVESDMGEEGINLVAIDGGNIGAEQSLSFTEYRYGYYENSTGYEFDNMGGYHAVITPEIDSSNNRTIGITATDMNGMLIEGSTDGTRVADTFMHELGHQMGLTPSMNSCIDSTSCSWSEYSSTMNYNNPSSGYALQYSDSDWDYIESNISSNMANTSKIREEMEDKYD